MNIIVEILLVYAVQIAEIFSFIGIGSTLFKLLNLKLRNFHISTLPLIFVSLGIIAITTFASLLNFFFPINYLVASGIILFGIMLFIKNKHLLSKIIRYSLKPIVIMTALIFILSLSWGIQIADSFGYHILASKWVAESNMPIGQANLDVRLGYNSLIFTAYAVTDFLMFKINKPFFSFFAVFFPLFIYAAIMLLKRSFNKKRNPSFSDYYLISFLIIIFIYNRSVGSLATDLSAIIFGWLNFYFVAKTSECEKAENKLDYIKLTILYSTFTSTIKLSMAPICLIPIFYVFYFIKNSFRKTDKESETDQFCSLKMLKNKAVLLSIGLSLLLITIFTVKGYLQSGYPAFPNTSLPLNVSWKVPAQIADDDREFICNFAKDYSHYKDKEYMKSMKWISRWLIQFTIYERALWLTALMVIILIIMNKKIFKMNKLQKLMMLTSIIGIIFVLYNAPSVRFAHLFAFTSLFMPLCVLLANKRVFTIDFSRYPKLPIFSIILSIIILLCALVFIYDNYFGNRLFHTTVLKLFPATQTRSLPFVYAAFATSLSILGIAALYCYKWLKNKLSSKENTDYSFLSVRILVFILFTASLAHIGLEIPAIFGAHTRLRFPKVTKEVNCFTNGFTIYHYSTYTCNYGLLATTYKHKVEAKRINGRYYFFFPEN